jgi:uncharacterized protein (DUF433 family)
MPPTPASIEKVHVTRIPGVCGGKPCIAGTRIRVWDVFVWHELEGKTPAEIVSLFPQLTLADVHAAMAYFWDHETEIRAGIARGETFAEELRRRQGPSKMDRFLDSLKGREDGDEIPA